MRAPDQPLFPFPALSAVAWMLFLGIVGVAVVLSVGCSIPSGYVIADRMTYDSIAPAHILYVAEDDTLSEEQKERRYRLIDSWEARVLEAESDEAEGIAPVDTGCGE